MPAVSISELSFAWPGLTRPTICVPDFTVQSGEMVFISGPSGCGKSTLLSLTAGILRPTKGEIKVAGIALSRLSGHRRDKVRGDKIGFIFQQFNLIPYLSILDNVLLPCRFSAERRKKAAGLSGSERAAAENMLERLDLAPELWSRRVSHLSVGQQQRAAAARALIGAPPLIIADEPTSALDADRRSIFIQTLLAECRKTGSSLLFVSHDRELSREFPRSVSFDDLNQMAPQ